MNESEFKAFNKVLNDPMNELDYWYPRLPDDIPTPRTIIIPIPETVFGAWFKAGRPDAILKFVEQVKSLDWTYPLFIKTGKLSGKHDYPNTCYVASPEKFLGNFTRLMTESIEADVMVGCRASDILCVREYIDLYAPFKAFNGLPIAKERRYFVRDGQVICHHPYWIPDAIRRADDEIWERKLAEINNELPDEIELLSSYAVKAVKNLEHNYWSVDFAMDKKDKWWLIDMGFGEVSYHWHDCPNEPEIQKRDRIKKEDSRESFFEEYDKILKENK